MAMYLTMATASLSSSSCWAFSRSSALTSARLRRSSSTAVSGYGGRRSSSTTNAAAANYLQHQNHRSQSLSANAKRSEQQTRLFSTTEEISDSTTSNLSEEETLASLKSPFLQTMRDRGFLFQCTNLSELDALLTEATSKNEAVSAYLGFDATADSLHVGSLLQIMILRHLQQSGHRPIVLIGGGTSKVGDPTGKDESRIMLNDDIIKKNTDGISQVFQKFLTFGEKSVEEAIMVNNDEWLSDLKYLQFLRDYGTHFTINRMMSFESVKQRLAREAPFSFLEFNYMILQAYDFLELNRRYNAQLQLGGSDQWGNMISGCELGRRVDGKQLYALTAPLITTSDGKKMGKTAGGAVWLNADKLSEYDYWQFWRNTSDEDVIRFLKLFTELSLEEIEKMAEWQGADINKAKVVLADEATALLHGRECLAAIHDTIDTMFKGGKSAEASTEGLARIFVSEDELNAEDGVKVIDLFVKLGLASSKKEARRLVQGGGAKLGEEKIEDEFAVIAKDDFDEKNELTLRAGKKRAGVVELK
jgi:tyrosyl-tRNA synthetase